MDETARFGDPFWTNIYKDSLQGEPVRARNMYMEATMVDFIVDSLDTVSVGAMAQVMAEYRPQYEAKQNLFDQEALSKLPLEVQENLMLLDLFCDEVVRSAGLNPEGRGDAFGDTTAEIYVDSFQRRAAALLRKNPKWNLTDMCEYIRDHEDWYKPAQAVDAKF